MSKENPKEFTPEEEAILSELAVKRKTAAAKVKRIDDNIDRAKANLQIECRDSVYGRHCGKKSRVGDLVYLQTHWYVSPSGCMGGDYWNPGEGKFVCPHCGLKNRLFNRPEITELKHKFKRIENVHER